MLPQLTFLLEIRAAVCTASLEHALIHGMWCRAPPQGQVQGMGAKAAREQSWGGWWGVWWDSF